MKRGPKPKDPTILFWSHVKRNTSCWEWIGAIMPNGYGHFHVKSKDVYAHRFSYMIHHGEIPKGMMVLHSCDNRACVNPNHLFIGTAKINTADMHFKNRWRPGVRPKQGGEKNPNAKLNNETILKIRDLSSSGIMQKEIAKIFKISTASVSLIVSKKLWKHL